MKKNQVKKKYIIVVIVALIITSFVIPFIISEAFKIKGYNTSWKAADSLAFYGTYISAVGTIVLGVIAWQQNKRLLKLEENTFLAQNSCSVLINSIAFDKFKSQAFDSDKYDSQIVYSNKLDDSCNYSIIEIIFKLTIIDNIPALILLKQLNMSIDNGQNPITVSAKNDNIEFTQVAVSKEYAQFAALLILSAKEKTDIINHIKNFNSFIWIDAELSVLSDKYVSTNILCRANLVCDDYDENNSIFVFDENQEFKPPVFFWHGNEVLNKDTVKIKTLSTEDKTNGQAEDAQC